MVVDTPQSLKAISWYAGLLAENRKAYFTSFVKKYAGSSRLEVVPTKEGVVYILVHYSLVDNHKLIKDLTTNEYLDKLRNQESCFCCNGEVLVQPTIVSLKEYLNGREHSL